MIVTVSRTSGYTASANQNNYYSITLPTAQMLDLDVNFSFGTGYVYLIDASGNTITYDYGSSTSDAWLNRVVAAGTYFIDVKQSSTNAAYTLTTSVGSPTTGSVSVENAGATLATARSLGNLTSTPTIIADAIGGGDTTDYYSFNVATTSQINFLLSGLANAATLYVENAAGQTLYSANGSATSNASIIQSLPYLTPGTYYVEVYDTNSTPTGYNLSLTATPEPSQAGPTLISAGSLGTLGVNTLHLTGALNSVASTAYYSFSLAAPSSVTLTLSGLTDTETLTLRDANGNSILSRSGDFTNGTIDIFDYLAPPSLGTYFVTVQSNLSSSSTLPYTLSVSAAAVVDSGGNTLAAATALGTIGAATVVKGGYLGTVNPADYYLFSLATAATVNFTYTASFDEHLTLYSSAGASLGGTLSQSNGELLASYTLGAGSYYFATTPASGADENYAIRLSTTAVSVGTSATNYAGTSITTAKSLGALSATPVDISDWVGAGDTDDWYSVTLATAGQVELNVSGNTAPIGLYLLTSTGGSVSSTSGSVYGFTSGSVATGASIWQNVAAGTYYVHVQDTNSSNNTGYHLSASTVPSGGVTVPDIAGNTIATGLNIGTLGSTAQTFTDFVGTTDSDDYYQFTVSAAATTTTLSTVNLKLTNVSTDTQYTSSYLYLKDISGNTISYDSESFHDSANLQQILAPGIYFADVKVSYATNNTYTLSLSATPLADASSPTPVPNPVFLPTAAMVAKQIDTLEGQVLSGSLTTINLADAGTPTIAITYAQAVRDINVLKAITTPYILDLSATPEKYAGPTLQVLGLGGTAAVAVQFSDGQMVFNTTSPAAQVFRMYLSAFGRVPDPNGQHSWDMQVEAGATLTTMAQAFIGSAEFIARYGSNLTDNQFITLLFKNVLNRLPDTGGLAGWIAALAGGQTRAQVLVSFSESAEHIAITASTVQAGIWDLSENAAQVARLYDTVYGRLPDAGGLAAWTNLLRSGALSLSAVANDFVGSVEFQARYGALNNADFIANLYLNALRRPADQAGQAGWVAQLTAGVSRATVVLDFSESTEHQTNTAANVLNPSPMQQGVLAVGPVLAAGATIGASLDALESQVKTGVVTSLGTADPGVAAIPVTLSQLTSDKDALSFITGSFEIDMSSVPSATAGASSQSANLGNTTAAKYVQFSNGRLVFDAADRASQVYRMYDAAFGRVSDIGGEHSWSQTLASGTSLATVAQTFLDSAEFANRYGVGLSDTVFVSQLYQNVLHRAPDAAGLNGWLLALGTYSSRAQVLTAFSESTEHMNNTASSIHLGIYDVG